MRIFSQYTHSTQPYVLCTKSVQGILQCQPFIHMPSHCYFDVVHRVTVVICVLSGRCFSQLPIATTSDSVCIWQHGIQGINPYCQVSALKICESNVFQLTDHYLWITFDDKFTACYNWGATCRIVIPVCADLCPTKRIHQKWFQSTWVIVHKE